MAGKPKYTEKGNIMIDNLLMKDPAFRRGFYMGFKGKAVIACDDWDEDLHPRDDDGKFTFGEGGAFGGSGPSGSENKKQEEPGSNAGKVTTRAEADARLASLFKEVQPSFNVSDEHAISIANALTKLNDEFGIIDPANASLEGFDREGHEHTRAMSRGDPATGVVRLSYGSKYFKDMPMEEYLANAKNETMGDRYHMPCDTGNREELMSYITHHEYGHLVENSLIREKAEKSKVLRELKEESDKYYGGATTPLMLTKKLQTYHRISRAHEKEIVKIAEKNNPNFNLRSQISQYGRTSSQEFFAECFANSQLSKPNELGMAMREFLKKHKIGKSNQQAPRKKK